MQGGVSTILESGVNGISEDGTNSVLESAVSIISQGVVIVFPLQGACPCQKSWLWQYQGMSRHRNPHNHSPTSVPSASHSKLSSWHCPSFAQAQGEFL